MITRPVVIVSAPRSGSTLLFETLAGSPDLWSVGGESHAVIEGIPRLHPRTRAWESNRLGAADADPVTVRQLRGRFRAAVRDREGRRATEGTVRLLEKTPRNTLRIPFLHRVFPDATFVHLHRDPVETMSSMLDGWRSGRHVSYPGLPGWSGPPWSFLLVPGWRDLDADDLPAVVAHQWATTVTHLLDGLAGVPPDRLVRVRYRDLVTDPGGTLGTLCERLGLAWDRPLVGSLPLSSTTLDPPTPDKWRRNAAALEPALRATATVAARVESSFALS